MMVSQSIESSAEQFEVQTRERLRRLAEDKAAAERRQKACVDAGR